MNGKRRSSALLLLLLLVAYYTFAQSAIDQKEKLPIDSLWEVFEAHFVASELVQSERIVDVLDSLYRTLEPLDSNAISMLWGHRVNFRGIERNMLAGVAAIDSVLAYAPDTPEGRSDRLLYMMLRINYAQTAGLTGNIYPDIKRLAYQLALDTIANPSNTAKMYAGIAGKMISLGYYGEGEEYLRTAQRIYETIPPAQVMVTSRRIPVLLTYLRHLLAVRTGDFAQSRREVERAQALYAAGDFSSTEKQTLKRIYANEIEQVVANFGQLSADQRGYIGELLDRVDRLPTDPYKIYIANSLLRYRAIIARQEGRHALAEQYIDSLLRAPRHGDRDLDVFFAEKIVLLTERGEFAEARPLVDTVLLFQHTGAEPLAPDYHNFRAGGLAFIKDALPRTAAQFAKAATPAYDSLALCLYRLALDDTYANFRATRSSARFRERYQPILRGMLRLAARNAATEQQLYAEVLSALETFEGGPAWQQFANSRQLLDAALPDSLREIEQGLYAEITRMRNGADEEGLFVSQLALEDFQQRLATTYPDRFGSRSPEVDVESIQRQLRPRTLLIRYQFIGDSLYRFCLNQARIEVANLGSADTANAWVERWSTETVDALRLLPAQYAQYERLAIVPDGVLHRLPFEVLSTPTGPLLRTHTIHYLPFLSFHQLVLPDSSPPEPLLAVAPVYATPAPPQAIALRDGAIALAGAAAESRYLIDLFGGELLTEPASAKADFLARAPDARLLHLAMHARIDNEQPELSHFDFAEGDAEGDRLYVEELYGLNLGAELAVLSACNTGRGEIDDTKGLVSLHRAFTYAGVPATVASLWAVPDASTAQIMQRFYERLHDGEAKDVALRGAKLDYLAATTEPALRDPLYWAGFVLYGDPAPVSSSGMAWWWWVLGAGVVTAGVWMVRRGSV